MGSRAGRAGAALIAAVAVTALATSELAAAGEPTAMTLESPAFDAGAEIPVEFACSQPGRGIDGQNLSPPLEWSKPPKGTKELVVVLDDPDAPKPAGEPDFPDFVHWTVWNLKPKTRSLAEGAVPKAAREGANDAGGLGYFGPCPPESHRYVFTVYALKTKLKLPAGASVEDVRAGLDTAERRGRVLGQGDLEAVFTP